MTETGQALWLSVRTSEIFHEKLQAKTNWGRNDVKEIYQQARDQAMKELALAK